MVNQALGIPLVAILIALSPQQAGGSGSETVVQEPQKTIEERTAGMHVRQPGEERAWLDALPEAMDLAPHARKEAKEAAKKAVTGARGQQGLVQTYMDNIWARVKSEFEDKGMLYDEQYLAQLVDENREDSFYENTHLFVLISESIPNVTLRNYQKALAGVPVTFVLRGLIGDDPSKFQPTQDWVQHMVCGEPPYETGSKCFLNPVDINPNLFRAFGIEHVPALVYVPFPEQIASCGASPMPDENYFVWYGDLAPAYVLEQIQNLRPDDMTLHSIIQKVGR